MDLDTVVKLVVTFLLAVIFINHLYNESPPIIVQHGLTINEQITNLERINHTLAYKLREVISDVNYRHNLDRGQLTSSYQLNSTKELDEWCGECHYKGDDNG